MKKKNYKSKTMLDTQCVGWNQGIDDNYVQRKHGFNDEPMVHMEF